MSGRAEKERLKLIQEKCQTILAQLLRDDDNKYCVDCDAKGPRWASWNLGIFLCIRCAGIHRNLGVHISKVKSINLDSWTAEQVAHLQAMGNSKARAVYEANLPDNFRRPTTDSALEAFIRAKYETKKYIAKEWVPPPPPSPTFDIDEEIKKEKEKRRHKVKTPAISNLDVQPNPLPRPHSQPAGTHIDAEKVPQNTSAKKNEEKPQGKASADLLGLDLQEEDPFDAFVSAKTDSNSPTKVQQDNTNLPAQTSTTRNDKDEEAEFFNQKAPEEKKVLSKESILSLYASAPPQPAVTPTATPFANQFQGLGNGVASLFPASSSAPFGGLTDPLFSLSSGNAAATPINQATMSQATMPTTNPFINAFTNNNLTQLQQQMVSLQLNQPSAAPPSWATAPFGNGTTLSTESTNQANPFLIPGMQAGPVAPSAINPILGGVNANPVPKQFNTDANIWQ